jgi:serine/threonine-protein kinase
MTGRAIGGRYELEHPLGGGAMSSVWLARDTELGRRVAVKLLARDADRARFEREAQAVAGLAHPNICQLYDYGESEDGPYMILEYLPGGTLEDLLQGKPLPDAQTTRIAGELAAGLAHAHERGLVHRDLKPANVLFDGEGRAKIADFGIARIDGGHALTEAGTVLGTAAYLSPEQAAGEPATPASDVYSFGVILFRMLTGQPPFVSNNAMELVRMHREQQPPTVEQLRPDAPPPLAALTAAALAKDPAQRPADGSALLDSLSGSLDPTMLIAPGGVAAEAAPFAEGHVTQVISRRPPRPARRRTTLLPVLLGGALVLAAVGAGAAYLVTGSGDSAPAKSTPSLKLPTVGREHTASSTTVATSAPQSTTAPTTLSTSSTEPTTTRETTTRETSTQQTTTTPATIPLPPTTASTTTAPPLTTAPLTTAPATTAGTTTAAATTATTATP